MINVATLLPWSEPKRVMTDKGWRMVREALPDATFWEVWQDRRDELKALGVQPSRYDGCGGTGTWVIYHWLDTMPPLPPVTLPDSIAALLRDYQRKPAADLVAGYARFPFMLDASQMGAGKTYTALAVVKALQRRPVVVCRKAAFTAWSRVAVGHFGFAEEDVTISNYEYVRTGNGPLGKWTEKQVTRDGRTRKIKVFEWTLPENSHLLLDEIHWASGLRTKNAQMLMAAGYQKLPTLGISATAATDPTKMWALGYALGLHHGRDFFAWAQDHGCDDGEWGLQFTCGMPRNKLVEYDGRDDNGKPRWRPREEGQRELDARRRMHMESIHHAIFSAGKGVRIRIDEVPGFPEIEIVPYAMNFDTTREISRAYADLREELDTKDGRKHRLALMKEAQQKIELLKVELVASEAVELIGEGYSVPIFCNFTASREKLCDLCNTSCAIYGDQKDSDRSHCLDQFQANREHIIVANIQAGGESIGLHDLHGQRQRVSYVFPTFWATALQQVLGRTRRDGAKSISIARIAFAAGTVEEEALVAVERKLDNIAMLNDADLASSITLT